MVQDWSFITISTLQNIWERFLAFIPVFLAAVIIFIIGWFIAIAIGRIIAQILLRLKFDNLFEKTGWKEALSKAELKVGPSEFVGAVFKWILVIVFLMISADILGLTAFVVMLQKIIGWLPDLIISVIILVVAIIIADILEKIIKASVKKIEVKYVAALGAVVRWAIYIFAVFAVLLQLGVATTVINTLVMGFIFMISLAFGLAFGLGGKEAAAKFIEDFKGKISEK
jgi:hypothetical protein